MEKPLKPLILNGLRGFLLLQTVKVGRTIFFVSMVESLSFNDS